MSVEDDAQTGESCTECNRALTDGECLTDGCPGPESDTSAAALMGGYDDSESDESDCAVEQHDPAEDHNAYLQRIRGEAEQQHPDIEDGVRNRDDWAEMSDDERTKAVLGRPRKQQSDSTTSTTDAPADPHLVDWDAFAREFNFHLAGQGCQNRHTTQKKLEIALGVSENVATSSPGEFLSEAVADERVPLVKDRERGYLFADEVLA